jgi:hypothetical protein
MKSDSYPSLMLGAIALICFALCSVGNATDTVKVWYGNCDGSPIWAAAGYPTRVDVWMQTGRSLNVSELHLCLGVLDEYIAGLILHADSVEDCVYTNWDCAVMISDNYHTPPNIPGWSSQSFIGKADTGGYPNIPINTSYPKRVLTFYLLPENNPDLIGDTIACLGVGQNPTLGTSWASDTAGPLPLIEYYSPLNFAIEPETCNYVFETDSLRLFGVVTFLVRYFKGIPLHLPPEAYCTHPALPGDHRLLALYDYNGNCEVNGADVLFLVGYLKGIHCRFYDCPLTPYRIIYQRQIFRKLDMAGSWKKSGRLLYEK